MAQIKYNLGNVKNEVNYSTDEQVIGTWIDGKPLYRKVVVIDNPSEGMTFSIANIDEPINIIWKQARSSGLYFSYGHDGTSYSVIYFDSTSKNFVVQMGGGFNGKMVAIVEYTKTID